MSDIAETTGLSGAMPGVRVVGMDRPWLWLARGWDDVVKVAPVSFVWALLFVAAGAGLIGGAAALGAYEAILPLAAGFPLFAPVLVVGLYEVSRRLEIGGTVGLGTPLAAWRGNLGQIALMGCILGFVFLVWVRIATLLFALFFGTAHFDRIADFAEQVVFTGNNVVFLAIGTAIGAVIALGVFAIAAVSVPMLLDQKVGVATAIATSFAAVRANPRPMLLWAALIALFAGAGLLVALVGLIVTLPLIAHATWHAYRDLVEVKTSR